MSNDHKQPSLREILTKRSHYSTDVRSKNPKDKSFVLTKGPQSPDGKTDFLTVKMSLHQRLLGQLERQGLLGSMNEYLLKEAVDNFIKEVVDTEDIPINKDEIDRLSLELTEETLGMGPLAPLMADPAVSDILVNGFDEVYVERFGRLEKTNVSFKDAEHLTRLIQRIVSSIGRRIDESSPYVDARLPDGSRVNATIPPITIDGPTLSIRRFGRNRLTSDDLVRLGSLSKSMIDFLSLVIEGRRNIAISGGTGAGKSTLLSALAKFIPEYERIITIEDTAELMLDQEHVIRCETRPPNIEGRGEITARDLLRNSLRMRPDRIIVGEVRGAEAFDMLQAMNTGHEGSMTTLHANSPRDAFARLESMVLMASTDLPARAIREQFVSALDLLIHIERSEDGVRRVTSIVELVGMEGDVPQIQEIFKFLRLGRQGRNVQGRFVATGIVPRFIEKLRIQGKDIAMDIFSPEKGSL
jgi:pilus assembly protein CpaF